MKKFLAAASMLALVVAARAFQATDSKPLTRGAAGSSAAATTARLVNSAQLLEDVRILSSDAMEGRATGSAGAAMARSYILKRFGDAGIKPLAGASFEQTFKVRKEKKGGAKAEEVAGTNVVGYVRGKNAPERFVVVTAHYDHLGTKGGKVYNGADDNASGVAVLLQLAAHFGRERPHNSIIFAALDAEEEGLLGAKALVSLLQSERLSAALNVNLDMVGHSERGELYAAGTFHTPALRPLLEGVASRAPVKLLLGHDRPEQGRDDWTTQSDQLPFFRAGIPFVYFGVEDHKDYHKPSDDFETITKEFFVNSAETILDAVKTLDASLPSGGAQKT